MCGCGVDESAVLSVVGKQAYFIRGEPQMYHPPVAPLGVCVGVISSAVVGAWSWCSSWVASVRLLAQARLEERLESWCLRCGLFFFLGIPSRRPVGWVKDWWF